MQRHPFVERSGTKDTAESGKKLLKKIKKNTKKITEIASCLTMVLHKKTSEKSKVFIFCLGPTALGLSKFLY